MKGLSWGNLEKTFTLLGWGEILEYITRGKGVYSVLAFLLQFFFFRSECEAQVKQYPGARYKGFASHSDAQDFVDQNDYGYSKPSASSNSYAHQKYSGNFTSRYKICVAS